MYDAWKNVLAEIKTQLPEQIFTTWFADTELISVKGGIARVGVPNVFKQGQLKKKFDPQITAALRNAGVDFTVVEYILQGKSKVKRRPREINPSTDIAARTGRVERIKTVVSDVAGTGFQTGLNAKYNLSNFVTGSNNDLAVSVAKYVIENPGQRYNPFFLYGGPGLGKTHLVQAIGNELLHNNPKMRILYIPVNHFYTEFISAVQKGGMEKFRKKYSSLDVLIIDDFQLIVGKDKSQEEFFNIFNDMHQAEKQIIVTSDRLPDQLKEVDERLSSRLAWTGPVDLQMPSFEDRCAILKSKAEFQGIEIEDEAIEYLAENVKTNIRELEGAFNRVTAMAELRGMTPLALINDGYVGASSGRKQKSITPKRLVEKVAHHFDLSVKEMCGRSRVTHIKTARQVAMYLLSEELQMSTTKIAPEVGVKDHSTVMHGIKKIKQDMKLDFKLREDLATIRDELYD